MIFLVSLQEGNVFAKSKQVLMEKYISLDMRIRMIAVTGTCLEVLIFALVPLGKKSTISMAFRDKNLSSYSHKHPNSPR
jgi:hypothetical protein